MRRMSRQMLSASAGSLRSRYRSACASAAGIAVCERAFRSNIATPLGMNSPREHPQEPAHRIVEPIHHALLQGDDRVLGNRNVFRADVRAATGDVAVADAVKA